MSLLTFWCCLIAVSCSPILGACAMYSCSKSMREAWDGKIPGHQRPCKDISHGKSNTHTYTGEQREMFPFFLIAYSYIVVVVCVVSKERITLKKSLFFPLCFVLILLCYSCVIYLTY
jgi:hypothetical protein